MKTSNQTVKQSWLGLVPYENSLELQKRLQQLRIDDEISDHLLVLEHPPVVTTGADPKSTDHFKIEPERLEQKGIEVADTRRGGHLTYHGPGQLVAYPIFKLGERDVEAFIRQLEKVIIGTLAEFDIDASRDSEAGVRVDGRKIASIGIQFSRWTSRHGLALNVDLDLKPFDYFSPCANPNERMTTIEDELDRAPMMQTVRDLIEEQFSRVFNFEIKRIDDVEVWNTAYDDIPDRDQRKLLPRRGDADSTERKPPWLKATIPGGENYKNVRNVMDEKSLNTVCEEASCPNLGECWDRGTATFMILGDTCTRACGFCDVKTGTDLDVDELEPLRVAKAVSDMDLDHAVITSVNRDDLPDGGAEIWNQTVESVREQNPETSIEVLIPDLMGNWDALQTIFNAKPDILNHNVETVPRLYPTVRPKARYQRSLELLQRSSKAGFPTKSGIMLGLGERKDEVKQTLSDLYKHGVRILTLGQYLRPSDKHLPVDRWVHPEEFDRWQVTAEKMGFDHVESGPLVRSSYHADEQVPATARNG